ncbi:PAS domain S-box protein [Cyanobium sp. Tous-M-B4]|uniref:PAS domain S-box protein n=2 Tax=unclassified Cyanobium TaxID=2627006 RepID=UPI0020CD6473|nr:PAS domain S-box protein [Cyanobium sp. Tous-M-B4]
MRHLNGWLGPFAQNLPMGAVRSKLEIEQILATEQSQPESTAASVQPTIESLQNGDSPFVLADSLGQVVSINQAFEQTYGWTEDQLRGQSLSLILPGAFQMSHQLGFSRFQATEQSTILAHPLRLKTVCADGSEVVSEHFILGEKRESGWVFGATLTPLPGCAETDA